MNMRQRAVRRALKPVTKDPVTSENDSSEDTVCRTCLATEELISIFDNEDTKDRSEELKLVTGLEIKLNDGLSQKICKSCARVVRMVMQFRKTSRKAEKALLNKASEVRVKRKYKKRPKPRPRPSNVRKSVRIEQRRAEEGEDCAFDLLENDFEMEFDYSTMQHHEPIKIKEEIIPDPPETSTKKPTEPDDPLPYKCDICGKRFRMKTTYISHKRFHTIFSICELCGKRFRNYQQMQIHKMASHGMARIHKCAFCDYNSATKENLTIHERRHTGEKPYVCDHCGTGFHRRSNLVQHIPSHLPVENFQCDMCPKKLKSRKYLQIHKNNVHEHRYIYPCPLCEHSCKKPYRIRLHLKRVHKVPLDKQKPVIRISL